MTRDILVPEPDSVLKPPDTPSPLPPGLSATHRPQRLRATASLRRLVRETQLSASDLALPLFLIHGEGIRRPITSMPGVYQHTPDEAVRLVEEAASLGLPAVLLFGLPATKDVHGSGADDDEEVVQQTVRLIKRTCPEVTVITDVCLCEYTDHGHCGLVALEEDTHPFGTLLTEDSLARHASVACSHARAGADVVAPSCMLDGVVGAVRQALDAEGYRQTSILSYTVKYASAFYGPFREAADSAPAFGDRRVHQMDPANAREALKEAFLDLEQGADVLMVKPALLYLDVVRRLREAYPAFPLAAYQVSGEYAMLKAAAERGWLDERRAVLEALTSIKRAGADFIVTYYALDAARWLHSPAQ